MKRQIYRWLPNLRKRLLIQVQELSGAAHCQVDDLELVSRHLVDYLTQLCSPP